MIKNIQQNKCEHEYFVNEDNQEECKKCGLLKSTIDWINSSKKHCDCDLVDCGCEERLNKILPERKETFEDFYSAISSQNKPSPKLGKEQTKLDLEAEIFVRLYYALSNVNVGIAVNSIKDLIEKSLASQKEQIIKEFIDGQRCLSCGDYKEIGILTDWCDKCLETK